MLRGVWWNRYCLCCPYHVETYYWAAKDEGRVGQQQLSLFHDKCDLAQRSNLEMLTTPSWQAISALQTSWERQNMSVYLSYSSMKQHIFQTMWSFCYLRLRMKSLVMHSEVEPCNKMVMLTSRQFSNARTGQNPAKLETNRMIICSNV